MELLKPLKTAAHGAGRWYIRRICRSELISQRWTAHNERPIEFRFALEALNNELPQTVLDVGAGTTAWPHLIRSCGFVVTAIDNVKDYWPEGMTNRHWTVLNADITYSDSLRNLGTFDAISCISVLEHIVDHAAAIRNMVRLLNPMGVLILTTPYSHNHFDPNVYKRADALYGQDQPYICRSSSRLELATWMAEGLRLEKRELWRLFTGPVWATGDRIRRAQAHSEDEPHQLGCFLFRKTDPTSTPAKVL